MSQAGRRTPAALAIDVGGTKIAAALVDQDGNILSLRTVPTGNPGDNSLRRAASLGEQVAATAEELGMRVVGAGIGLPELVEDGRITSHAVVAWTDEWVESAFARYGTIRVEADIRAAALAECRFGSGGRAGVTLYVNLGTGISHCLLIDGRPFEGQHGRALMSGSTLLTALDEQRNDLVGCRVEDVASGRGISERYSRLSGRTLPASAVFERARNGDTDAVLVMTQSIDLLGHLVASLIDILDPGLVILGGGLAEDPGLVDGLRDVALRAVWSDRARRTPIVTGSCGPSAGVIGAGLSLLDRLGDC
ncbi:MAG: ROK family protein [Acidimicrobiia bacterium]|nr:ROK family protein [Acidimicrobiia bacterium]